MTEEHDLDALWKQESAKRPCQCYVGRLDPKLREWLDNKVDELTAQGRSIPWTGLGRVLSKVTGEIPTEHSLDQHYVRGHRR